jgi:signal transduction histidine kinase
VNCQTKYLQDSLQRIINKNKRDTAEVNALVYLAYFSSTPESCERSLKEALVLSNELGYKKGIADCNLIYGGIVGTNFGQTLQHGLAALSIYKEIKDNIGIASSHGLLQGLYRDIGDYRNALYHEFECLHLSKAFNIKGKFFIRDHPLEPAMLGEIAQSYILMDQLDSAYYFTQKAIQYKETFFDAEWNFPVYELATIQTMKGNYDSALANYRRALPLAVQNHFFRDTLQVFSGMSTLFKKRRQFDSAIHYAHMVAVSTNPELEIKSLLEAVANLAEAYKLNGNKDSAIKYIELSYKLRDSIFSDAKKREIQSIAFNENLKQEQLKAAQLKYKSKVQVYIFSGGVILLLLIAGLLWRSNHNKQKAKQKIENAYSELKSAQQQLIQSEKMASLGELTAGIAHEIQNPLNFVNNFSEVNDELLKELKTEAEKGNLEEVKAIANDIAFNSEKINHHGKRADSIVKGMLQHSRSSTGQKEPTDINALCDEYLRLSYHGLRAKDKSFNAITKTEFDDNVGKIKVVSQDLGRVILNLINNAFYAVNEKQKQNIAGYEPTVIVNTKKEKDMVKIEVKDNGNGIPQKILDKIFQPFFTTKPTGQGTGLGLSLSYDIVKAHGGELKVETKEGEGSKFIILLNI